MEAGTWHSGSAGRSANQCLMMPQIMEDSENTEIINPTLGTRTPSEEESINMYEIPHKKAEYPKQNLIKQHGNDVNIYPSNVTMSKSDFSSDDSSKTSKYRTGTPDQSQTLHAQLNKLKTIHQKAKHQKRLKQVLRIFRFLMFKVLIWVCIFLSIIFLLCGHLLKVRLLLVSGCIMLLGSVGCFIQICFSTRTAPNKFDPVSVPFYLPASDLMADSMNKSLKNEETEKKAEPIAHQLSDETNHPETQEATQENSKQATDFAALNVRRLSMALARVTTNGNFHAPYLQQNEGTGNVLNLARRLTMVGSSMTMRHPNSRFHNDWTGPHMGERGYFGWNDRGYYRG